MLGVEAYGAFRPEAAVEGAAPMVTQRAMVPARSGRLFPDVGRHLASTRPATVLRPALKRMLDVAGAFGLAVALLPLLLVVAALVKADGGPVLFAHERVGRGGRRFGCLKFRSMVVDSAERLEALLAADPEARAEWDSTRKLKRDPRVTAVGRFLRASSLDELPQLLNVLRGETPTLDHMQQRVDLDLWYVEHSSVALDLAILARTVANAITGPRAY